MTIEFKAIEFSTTHEAIQHFDASSYGDAVISLDGKSYVTHKVEAERLAAAGVEFAYVFDHEMPNGEHRLMTVPLN